MKPRLPWSALAVLLVLLVWPVAAPARCRTADEMKHLARAARSEIECRAAFLAGDAAPGCGGVEAPACGAGALGDLADVALGSSSRAGPALGDDDAAGCQIAIARAAGGFVHRRLHERARHSRRSRGARILDAVARRCDGVGVRDRGGPFPGAGGRCAGLTPAGGTIDGPALARCVRASLSRIVDDVAPEPLRPNVVLVLTDDQRADTLAWMPATVDRLAARGLAFPNAFATTPSCSPSRASLYTGRLARRHGVIANGREAELDPASTIAPALAEVGYTNGFFGKYLNDADALGPAVPSGWHRFTVFRGTAGGSYFGSQLHADGVPVALRKDEYSTDVLADRALGFVRANASRPFLLVYAPFAPHAPSKPAPRHRGTLAGLPPHRPPSWREADLALKPLWVQFFARISDDAGALRRDRQRIRELETLRAVDEAVARLADTVERLGLGDDTLFVFTSDNGIHWGEHWTGTKFSAYEESIRVPLVLAYPSRIPVAAAAPELVANVDLAPTLAELAGASLAPGVDGASLVPLIDAGGSSDRPAWRPEVPIESWGGLITRPSRALRTGRWKYIEVDADAGVREELYDLDADPFELENRAFDPAFESTRAALAARLATVLP